MTPRKLAVYLAILGLLLALAVPMMSQHRQEQVALDSPPTNLEGVTMVHYYADW